MNTQLPSIHLVVQEGTHPGQVFVIQKHTQTIGRSASNDIPIAEPSLSRQHAQIRAAPDGFVIEDLGSTNGTFVNGQRVTDPTWLRPGDTLQLGNVVTFSIQSGQPGQLPTARPDAISAPSTPYYQPPASPVPPHIPPSPPAAASYPPGRLSRAWIWAGVVVVAVLMVGVVLGGLYYYLAVLRVPPTQAPTGIAEKPAALQAQQIWVEPTLTSTPTATSAPTPEPVEIAVPGLSAIVAEEGEPPQNVRQINASCNSQVEVRTDEPVIINWDWRAAQDSETDYLAQWLDVAYYDVRLDGVPITKVGSFKYYRTESCGDKGQCGPTLRWWVNVGLLSAGTHHVTLDAYTTRAVSDGFDINPADGEPDVYGPGLAEQHFCDVNVAEIGTPIPAPTSSASTPTPTPTPTQGPTLTQMPASPLGVFQDFESESTWKRGDQPYGEFSRSTAQVHSGSYAGQLTYDFLSQDNEFVVFLQTRRLAGRPNVISSWVYGDKSGHYLNVWIKDAAEEVWQAPFGQIEHTGWQRMTAWLDPGGEWPHAHVSGPSNSAIDYPISFYALVLDDIPDTFSGRGTIYVDDLTSQEGAPPAPTPTLTTV